MHESKISMHAPDPISTLIMQIHVPKTGHMSNSTKRIIGADKIRF